MKFKIDENLPASLAGELQGRGHEADTVQGEGLAGASDGTVWEEAQRAGRFLITQDLDFSDIRKYAPGSHHGLLLIRLVEPGRLALARRILTIFDTEKIELWARCFVVASDHKVRVRRPPAMPPAV